MSRLSHPFSRWEARRWQLATALVAAATLLLPLHAVTVCNMRAESPPTPRRIVGYVPA